MPKPTLKDKIELLAFITDHVQDDPLADAIDSVSETVNESYKIYDKKWDDESYGASFKRYARLGRIPRAKVEELWMRAVLAGLHNQYEEQANA